jgi:hypothetical protein
MGAATLITKFYHSLPEDPQVNITSFAWSKVLLARCFLFYHTSIAWKLEKLQIHLH